MENNMSFQKLTDEMMRLYTDGKYSEAFELVERNADRFPDEIARTTFWRMCLLSMCNRPNDVMSVFQQGLDSGLWWAERQFSLDSDLDAVRDLPEFKRLAAISQEKYLHARAEIKPDRALLIPEKSDVNLPLLVTLHGRNGNKDSDLEQWEVARQRGWLVLSPQSAQPIYPGAYCWDESDQGLRDILFHMEDILSACKVDRSRIVIAGFSQGSGMALYAALSGKVPVRGFIGVGTWWADPAELDSLARQSESLRAYFVTGEKDPTFERIREIQNILRSNNIPFAEEVHADIEHEFPPDFGESFNNAIRFILER